MNEIKVGHLSTAYHTSIVLIGKPDWVEETGLVLNWKLYPTGPRIIDAMSRGKLDIGYVGLPPAIIGIGKGAKIKCVAGGHIEGTTIIARETFSSYEELNCNMKNTLDQIDCIGSPSKGSIHDIIIRELLKKHDLSDKVEIKNYSWADLLINAMEDEEIDAAIGTPPLAIVALENNIGKIILSPAQLWPFNPSYGIVVKEEIITESPWIIEKFINLHRRGSRFIRNRPREAARIISKVIDVINYKFALSSLELSPRYCTSLSTEFIKETMNFEKTLRSLGYNNKNLTEDDIFYRDIICKIHPEEHHY